MNKYQKKSRHFKFNQFIRVFEQSHDIMGHLFLQTDLLIGLKIMHQGEQLAVAKRQHCGKSSMWKGHGPKFVRNKEDLVPLACKDDWHESISSLLIPHRPLYHRPSPLIYEWIYNYIKVSNQGRWPANLAVAGLRPTGGENLFNPYRVFLHTAFHNHPTINLM